MDRAEVLKNFNKHKANKETIKTYLHEFDTFHDNLKLDAVGLLEQVSTSVQMCSKWGKVLSWINRYIDEMEAEFEQYESLLWLEKKRELQDAKVKDIKESDVRSAVRADQTRKKLRLILAEWRYYSNYVKDAAFWPATRMLDALSEFRRILIGGDLSYSPVARSNKEDEE